MLLIYGMIVERHPKPNGVVGSSIPSCQILSLLDGKTNQVVTRHMCSPQTKNIYSSKVIGNFPKILK